MLRERIKKEISKIVPKGIEFSVSRPERAEFGDYSSNVAMVAARPALWNRNIPEGGAKIPRVFPRENPREIAEDLKKKLEKSKLFKKIDVAGPGFLNFWIAEKEIVNDFKKFSSQKGLPKLNFGKGKTLRQARGKKIQVEFVSANPTGPLTLANGRGGFLGDVLANVLTLAGFKVEREYYVNDTGNQIITLGKSILASAGLISPEENFYKGDYVKKWADKNKAKIKKLKNEPLKLGQEAAKDFLKEIKTALAKKAKIKFDRWTSEDKHIHKKSFLKKALALFDKKNLSYKKEGALWLKTAEFEDDKDRVLMTSDGYPTYFLADAGHYLETRARGFKRKINILGPDHYGYVARIQAVAEILGMEESEIIVTQTVRLMKGGEEFKMSKRKGAFVVFEEVIDKIGLDAARWFFLERAFETHIDIDLDLARERSQKNPVYYVQYAHARMSSILRKAQNARHSKLSTEGGSASGGKTPAPPAGRQNSPPKEDPPLAERFKTEELKFIKKLLEVSDILEDTASTYQIHRLTTYAYELAQAFSAFYRDVKVLDSGEDEPRRLFVVKTAKNTLASLLKLLGISAPEKM